MPLTVFLGLCVLSFDFLLYVLFQWVYGEKHRKRARRVAARTKKHRALSDEHADPSRVLPFSDPGMHYRTGHS